MSKLSLSRRAFNSVLVSGPLVLRAKPSSREARVKIDTERVIGQIDPKIYGNFTEHLGRCIEGGIFEENSPLSDKNGFRKDVLKAVEDLHVTLLRWPGGNFSSNSTLSGLTHIVEISNAAAREIITSGGRREKRLNEE